MSLNGQPRRYDLAPIDVVVVHHVLERALERLDETFSRGRVRQEAFDAIFSGRFSRDKPGWLGPPDPERSKEAVYAWPPHFRYAFVILTPTPARLVVLTLLTPEEEDPLEAPLRKGLLRWLRQQGDMGVEP